MSGTYLTDLATVCRSIQPPAVHEQPGWQTRARGSGGYSSGRPTHVMIHHTASNPSSDGQPDVDYIISCADAPIANLYIARTGHIWVVAAGATNTNGSGHDWWAGGVPDDSMNTHAIGIEAANTGVGEPWADVQQRVYCALVRALCDAYGIPNNNVRTHYEWTDRKCDNTGPSRWAPPGAAGGCNGAGYWNMDGFRADVAAGWPEPTPEPLPPEEDDDMPNPYVFLNDIDGHPERGGCVIVESQGLRTIGGAEQNYVKFKKWDFVIIQSDTEWQMVMNARTKNVNPV